MNILCNWQARFYCEKKIVTVFLSEHSICIIKNKNEPLHVAPRYTNEKSDFALAYDLTKVMCFSSKRVKYWICIPKMSSCNVYIF